MSTSSIIMHWRLLVAITVSCELIEKFNNLKKIYPNEKFSL